MMRRMILCLACAAASPFVCVVITGFNAVDTCVEIKIYGAFVLNHPVVLHAIDATPARWRGDAVPHRSTEPGRPRHRREMT